MSTTNAHTPKHTLIHTVKAFHGSIWPHVDYAHFTDLAIWVNKHI